MKLAWITSSLVACTLSALPLVAAAAPGAPPEDVTTSCTGKKVHDVCTGAWDFVATPKADAKKGAVGGGSWVKAKEPGTCGVAVAAKNGAPTILQCNSRAQTAAAQAAKAAAVAELDAAADPSAAMMQDAAIAPAPSASAPPVIAVVIDPADAGVAAPAEKSSCSTSLAPASSSGFVALGLLALALVARKRALA